MNPRRDRLRETMRAHGWAAVAIMPGANLRYLTGLEYHPSKRLTLALFPAEGEAAFVLPAMESGRVRDTSRVPLRLFPWNDGVENGADGALRRCMDDLELAGKTVAVEFLAMRVAELRVLEIAAPGLAVTDVTDAIGALRMVKDADERAAMDEAARRIETALSATLPHIQPGVTEQQLAAIWMREILATGSPGASFGLSVASGPHSAFPHHDPTDRAFAPGDLIVLDGGALCEGYASDITRTVALGEPGEEARRIYELVRDANAAGRAACLPGVTGAEIDAAARSVIERGGYGPRFLHRTGHGLGLEIHEPPYLHEASTDPLPAGTTFTIEPGIYLEGVGGVRIEDDIVLTEDGAQTLTTLDRELIVLPAA